MSPGVAGHSHQSPPNSSFPGLLGLGGMKRTIFKLWRNGGMKMKNRTGALQHPVKETKVNPILMSHTAETEYYSHC